MKPIDQLRSLMRTAEDADGHELGPWIAEHAATLASDLGTDASDLLACAEMTDGVIIKRIKARIAARKDIARDAKAASGAALASSAAAKLGASATWTDAGRAVIDAALLLGDVLADKRAKWVGFTDPSACEPVGYIERDLLTHAAVALRGRPVVTAYVDANGLHIRFGRGGYNLRARFVPPHELPRDGVVTVELADRPARVVTADGRLDVAATYASGPPIIITDREAALDTPTSNDAGGTIVVEPAAVAPPAALPVRRVRAMRSWTSRPEKTRLPPSVVRSFFPIGARVLIDGAQVAIVREIFPEGSTSYAFPHYRLRCVGSMDDCCLALERVSVFGRVAVVPVTAPIVAPRQALRAFMSEASKPATTRPSRISGKSPRTCEHADGCSLHVHARNLCPRHYDELMKRIRAEKRSA